MNRLTEEEVLHVASLAKLKLTKEEIDKYSYSLKTILDEIEKINDVEVTTDEIMINPLDNECMLSSDFERNMITKQDILKNAPHKNSDYVEVRGVFDE